MTFPANGRSFAAACLHIRMNQLTGTYAMVSDQIFSRLSGALLAFCLTLLLSASPSLKAQSPSEFQRFEVAAKEGKVAGWFRWAVDGAVFPSSSSKLVIASDARCSLYVNGQRILKYELMKEGDGPVSAKAFDVHSLLRAGRNTVAVELQSEAPSARFLISLNSTRDGGTVVPGGPWKTAPAPPPVGWQQTDFNDRDWPEVKPTLDENAIRLTVQLPEKVAAPVVGPKARRSLPFQFEDGDHVAFVGATFVERAQLSEHLEATLTGMLGDKHVTFRNLGWSADTTFAESRGIFDAPATGYLRMVEHIRAEEPTVVFLCYGQNEALTSGITPENYARQLTQFIDELTASGIPCILISPHELFPAKAPIPSPSRFNSKIRVYSEATGSVAQSRQLAFVDLFTGFTEQMLALEHLIAPTTGSTADQFQMMAENGMHLTDQGYAAAALVVRQRLLGVAADQPLLQINPDRKSVEGSNVEVANVRFDAGGKTVRFEIRETTLSPLPLLVQVTNGTASVSGLEDSSVQLTALPGNPQAAGRGVAGYIANSSPQYEALRQAVLRKNELYFHRWRPQNITYLFGFRKHEQGNNAADIARFDPFIRDLETQIHGVQKPAWREVALQLAK